jgi:hypothetical protein
MAISTIEYKSKDCQEDRNTAIAIWLFSYSIQNERIPENAILLERYGDMFATDYKPERCQRLLYYQSYIIMFAGMMARRPCERLPHCYSYKIN